MDRFWSKVQVAQSGCWEWTARRRRGYGQFKVGGRMVQAHRFAYEDRVGPIPDGLWVLHRCDNPPCVNPDHLFLGSRTDNVRDMMQKGRARFDAGQSACAEYWRSRTHCPQGHPYDEENTIITARQRVCRACRTAWSRDFYRAKKGVPESAWRK